MPSASTCHEDAPPRRSTSASAPASTAISARTPAMMPRSRACRSLSSLTGSVKVALAFALVFAFAFDFAQLHGGPENVQAARLRIIVLSEVSHEQRGEQHERQSGQRQGAHGFGFVILHLLVPGDHGDGQAIAVAQYVREDAREVEEDHCQ